MTDWRTSTYSNYTNCVQVRAWRKSSYCTGGECVEIRADTVVGVRDSKDSAGPVLTFKAPGWAEFLARVKDG